MTALSSFTLPELFIEKYQDKDVNWGFTDAGGNSLGELTFIRTYSRLKEDGTKERWWEVCKRVIEGMYSIQKDYVKSNKLPWNDRKAQASAQEAFDRMFQLKWTPPGRGIWAMGTDFIMNDKNGSALQSCAAVSTGDIDKNDPGAVFAWVMDALMLGVGVGWDTKGKHKHITINQPVEDPFRSTTYFIPDSREGWIESIRLLINSYLKPAQKAVKFDYTEIRPYGSPIRGFGGTASGPKPLIDLHNKLKDIFTQDIGKEVGSRCIADIMNLIGTCVVAGNVRRSAELGVGEPDDFDFINLKNPEVFPERNSYDPEKPGWAWMSNNSLSVQVGQDYSVFDERVVSNGEPGFIWLETTKKYGRLIDPADNKDFRVVAFNPCVAGDTLVMTTDGPKQIQNLENAPFTAVVDGHKYEAPYGSFITGEQELFLLKTVEGYEVKLTDNHKVLTASGDWVKAEDLLTGDYIVINNHRNLGNWPGKGNEEDGYLLGLFVGDGNFGSASTAGNHVAHIKVWDEPGIEKIIKYSEEYARTLKHRSDWKGFSRVKDRPYQQMNISDLVYRFGLTATHNKHKVEHLEQTSSDFHVGFIRGLFDTDGHVEGYANDKGFSVRLGQSNYELLQCVQRMLLRLGMKSSIHKLYEEGWHELPNGKGGSQKYLCKESWRLIVGADSAKLFVDTIGFFNSEKMKKCTNHFENRKRFYHKAFVARVESLLPIGKDIVWDTTVENIQAFDANGLYVHNCNEQPLESLECCTLVEVHINRAESREDFLRTLKFAYLYGKTVTLLPTHWPQTNAVMQRNRRIGTSLTGISGFVENNGLPKFRTWAEEGYQEVSRLDNIYSEWLGIRESIRTTTVKPSGTVSLLSGATPGVHWSPGGKYYLRAVRFADNDPIVPQAIMAGYQVEEDLVSANTVVVYFPIHADVKRSEKEVSIFEKINLAAEAQKYWSDNGVSVTVSFDKEKESDAISTVLNMYEGQLKAVSFLPMGNKVYPQQPYTQISRGEYESYIGRLTKINFENLYLNGSEALGEKYCTNDSCEIPQKKEDDISLESDIIIEVD